MRLYEERSNMARTATVFLHAGGVSYKSRMQERVVARKLNRRPPTVRSPEEGSLASSRRYRTPSSNQNKLKGSKLLQFGRDEAQAESIVDDAFAPKLQGLADFRFRSELIRMLGTEIIRLGDKEWSHNFQKKLREDYEHRLEEQAYNLVNMEKERLHTLRLEGVISMQGGDDKNNESNALLRKAFIPGPSATTHRKTLAPELIGPKCHGVVRPHLKDKAIFKDEAHNELERELHWRRQKNTYKPGRRVSSELQLMEQKELERKEREKLEKARHKAETQEQLDEGFLNRKKLTPEERRAKRFMNLPEYIAMLYNEEEVKRLYRLADMIVRGVDAVLEEDRLRREAELAALMEAEAALERSSNQGSETKLASSKSNLSSTTKLSKGSSPSNEKEDEPSEPAAPETSTEKKPSATEKPSAEL